MQKDLKPKLIVVLGMHRAGTSAITRALEVLGVSLGNNLMPAIEHVNPKGFFEDLEVNALNIEMLSTVGSDWFTVSPISKSQLDLLKQRGFLKLAADLIQKKCRNTLMFGIKDPRISKLLPFWNQVFDALEYDVAFVLALRNPLSIAKSLEKRDGLQSSHSYLLWLGHMLESIRGSADRPRLVVDYDQLIQSPDVQVKRIASTLDLTIDESALQAYATDFLDSGLRHATYANEDLLTEPSCPILVSEIFYWLRQASNEQISLEDKRFTEASGAWFNEFERLTPSLKLIDHQLDQIDCFHRDALDWDTQIAQLSQARLEQEAHMSDLNQKVADRDTQIAQLDQARLKQEADIAELNQVVADQQNTVSALKDRATTLEQRGLGLQADLNKARETQAILMNSKSWRLTRPLRDARRWLANLK